MRKGKGMNRPLVFLLCAVLLLGLLTVPTMAAEEDAPILYPGCEHHSHDDSCGGKENNCTYACAQCAARIQGRVDALPGRVKIASEDRDGVVAQMEAIDALRNDATDNTQAMINWTQYEETAFVLLPPEDCFAIELSKIWRLERTSLPQASFRFVNELGENATLIGADGVTTAPAAVPEPNGEGVYYYLPAGTYTVEEDVEGFWDMTLTVDGETQSDATFTGEAGEYYELMAANTLALVDVWVGGVQMLKDGSSGEGYTFTYGEDISTLTLNNANILKGSGAYGIQTNIALEIVLEGHTIIQDGIHAEEGATVTLSGTGYSRDSAEGNFAETKSPSVSGNYFESIDSNHLVYKQNVSEGKYTHVLSCPESCTKTHVTIGSAEACSGGDAATCKTRSVCTVCEKAYGELDTDTHEQAAQYLDNGNSTHRGIYPCCEKPIVETEPHEPSYTADQLTIKADCGKCNNSLGNVTLEDPDAEETLIWDGQQKVAMTSGEITGVTSEVLPVITYQKKVDESWGEATEDAPTDSGTYLATMDIAGVSVSAEFIVDPMPVTVSWETDAEETLVYTGSAADLKTVPTVSSAGEEPQSEFLYSYSMELNGESISGLPVNVGTYYIYASVEAEGNYGADTSDNYLKLTIKPQTVENPDVSGVEKSYTYTGIAIQPEVTATDGDITLTKDTDYEVTYGNNTNAAKDGGKVTISFKGNYTGEAVEKTFDISKAVPVVTAPTANHLTYNGSPQTLVTGGSTFGGSMQYTLGTKEAAGSQWSDFIPEAKNAGTYYVWYQVVGDDNYETVAPAYVEVTIDQKELTPSIQGTVSKTYDGTVNVPNGLEITVNGVYGNEYVTAKASGFAFVSPNAGTKAVVATGIKLVEDASNDYKNYKLSATTVTADVGTINPKDMTNAEIQKANTLTYNGKEQTQLVLVKPLDGLIVTYDLQTNKETNAGDYTLTVSGTGNFTGSKTLEWSIAQKPLTVTAKDQTITYDEQVAQNGFAATGLISGHELSLVLKPNTDEITNNGTITPTKIKVTANGTDVTENYDVTTVNGKLVIQAISKEIEEVAEAVSGYSAVTVKASDKAAIEALLADIEEQLEDETLNPEEKQTLTKSKQTAQSLLKRLADAKAAANTESIGKAKSVTKDNMQLSDQQTLEKAKVDLNNALTVYGGNYTDGEKQAMQAEITRINGVLQSIENVKAVTTQIAALPADVEPDDDAACEKVMAAEAAYNALTTHERSLVNSTARNKLFGLIDAMTDYKVIKGSYGKWSKSNYTSLSFTFNGSFSKFVGIRVDGKDVSRWYYTADSGSTIINLRSFYLRSLKDGKHTLTVLYTDGEADCVFYVQPKGASPGTGDAFDPMLWGGILAASAAGLAVLLIVKKKNKK